MSFEGLGLWPGDGERFWQKNFIKNAASEGVSIKGRKYYRLFSMHYVCFSQARCALQKK